MWNTGLTEVGGNQCLELLKAKKSLGALRRINLQNNPQISDATLKRVLSLFDSKRGDDHDEDSD